MGRRASNGIEYMSLLGVVDCLEVCSWDMKQYAGSRLPVPAIETRGAASLHGSLPPHTRTTVRRFEVEAVASIAGSQGPNISKECIRCCLTHKGGVTSVVVEDARVVDMIESFAAIKSSLIPPWQLLHFSMRMERRNS
ncbi:hypothetical protein BT69DRAFT_1282723 [Atractiella rhizophila]|nr:hypothetical protein BT69DRAFT_1282723 [Atractiella rhizophila]